MLQAQLRGMIGDFKGGDEMLLSQALEAFDTLTSTTTEYRAALEGKEAAQPVAGMPEPSKLQPPGSNPFQVSACFFHDCGKIAFVIPQPNALGQFLVSGSFAFILDPYLMHTADIALLVSMLPQKNGCPALHPKA